DEGCLQYYTGVSGQLKSFNYDPTSGRQLSNQDYGICVRMERNFCGIQYTACIDPGKYTLLSHLSEDFYSLDPPCLSSTHVSDHSRDLWYFQQKSMTVYQREVEISPGPRSSVMKERP
ncbi:jg22345, partial [Pararge aegeria aegeria]